MSRSRKHLPIRGAHPVPSEKSDKQRWHRLMRRRERQQLGTLPLESTDAYLTTVPREVSDPLDFAKEGKVWLPTTEGEPATLLLLK
jgi:hypothetical protein